jgi:arsenical pump membrane protein
MPLILQGLLRAPAPLPAAVAAATLAALLLLPFRRPTAPVEAAAGTVAAALVLLSGGVAWTTARHEIAVILPVVAFLVASLVVAECCAAAGVFTYLGGWLRRGGRDRSGRLLALTVVLAATVTAVLSLDATVVMLTPVALAASPRREVRRPLALICSRLANSASLLLPVSNLTNLLAAPRIPLHFVAWAGVMALPWLAAVVVEYAAVRLRFRDGLTRHRDDSDVRTAPDGAARAPAAALAVVAAMLVGFAVGSPAGIAPFWVAGTAAVVLAVPALRRGVPTARLLRAAQPSFAVYVIGLVVVVAAVDDTFLGAALADLGRRAPVHGIAGGGIAALGGMLLLAGLATALTSVVNNLPALLLLLPLAAPLGTPALLAVLVGVDVGAGLVYTGSLANLLWTRVLRSHGLFPSARRYHVHAVIVTPVAVAAAVVALWAEDAMGWLPA